MEASNASNEELMAAAEREAAGEPNDLRWNAEFVLRCQMMKLKVKTDREAPDTYHDRMKTRELDEAMQRGYSRRWFNFYPLFQEGKLFGCQHFDFASMLMAKEEEVAADLEVWRLVESAANTLGLVLDQHYLEMRAFAMSRVAMPYANRKRYLLPDGTFRALALMTKDNQELHERHRKSFEEVRVKYRWWWASPWVEERAKWKAEYEAAPA